MEISEEQKLDRTRWDGVEKLANNLRQRNQGDQPTLFNTLLAALTEPRKGLIGYKGGKYAEAMRRNISLK